MIKKNLLRAKTAFECFCHKNKIISERINTNDNLLAYFIPSSVNEQKSNVKRFLVNSGQLDALQFKMTSLSNGNLYVLASDTLLESEMIDFAEDISPQYDKFHVELSKIFKSSVSEMNLKQPTSSLRRANAGTQFRSSMQDYQRLNKKKSSKKNINTKIDEALDGIATPNDIQPQQGLKSLFSALKQSGLIYELKKQGVSWNIAEPGRHAVTFIKDNIPILQLTSIELADAKTLGETLSQLASIAQGKAPQAAELELSRIKDMASRANERKGALDDIAQQYAVQKQEKQPIFTAGS